MSIKIEIGAGELADRITILEAKAARLRVPSKLERVSEELRTLSMLFNKYIDNIEITKARLSLARINLTLWDVLENQRHYKEWIFEYIDAPNGGKFKTFKATATDEDIRKFLFLSNQVVDLNDERAQLKRKIDVLANTRISEEKSHAI